MTRDLLGIAALIAIGIFYPVAFPAYLTVAITILLFAGWATAWDILGGWNGQVSLGHATFVGLGAYFVAAGQAQFALAPWWALLLAAASAGLLALVWGWITFNLRGPLFHALDHRFRRNLPARRNQRGMANGRRDRSLHREHA